MRLIGGILLVAGTAIGAGMLALPVISAFAGFFPSLWGLIACWAFMFATAWLILEVNLACPGDVNLISMAGRTLGTPGKLVCWVTYLLLLYSLTAAYLSGSAPLLLHALHALTGWLAPLWLGLCLMLVLFGLFVYLGTRSVDYVNRLLMGGLLISYACLVASLPSHVQWPLVARADLSALSLAIPVMITSFGFHIIIPTLTTYLRHNAKQLRLTILIGSLLPLGVYVLWEFFVLGIVPLDGSPGLIASWQAGESGAVPLAAILGSGWISKVANAFSFFAIITSFLGVSLSLSDFLGDGLKLHRFTWGREGACLLTFVPPFVFALAYPRGFLLALQYASVFVAILLGVLPTLMAWRLPKYRSHLKKGWLGAMLLLSLLLIWLSINDV